MGKRRTEEEKKSLVQKAFDHFKCTYVQKEELFQFTKKLTGTRGAIGRICEEYLGNDRARCVYGYYKLPTTTLDGHRFVDDPKRYRREDREFERQHNIRCDKGREPTPNALEKVLQATAMARYLDRIEAGLTILKKFYHYKTESGHTREIDLLCKDQTGNIVVIEFKRSHVQPRDVVGQVLEYMGHEKFVRKKPVRGFIVVGHSWSAIEYARLVVSNLEIVTYEKIFPPGVLKRLV